jgi:hypothetical protein
MCVPGTFSCIVLCIHAVNGACLLILGKKSWATWTLNAQSQKGRSHSLKDRSSSQSEW